MTKGKEFALEQLGIPKHSYRFDWEPPKSFRITSSAVLIHTYPLERRTSRMQPLPQILLVQQMDQVGCPYAIPAGALEKTDIVPVDTAVREIDEETGLQLDPTNIELLFLLSKIGDPYPNRRYALYSHQTDWETLNALGKWRPVVPKSTVFGNYYLLEDHARRGDEIGNLALLSAEDIFTRHRHPDIQLYRQEIWWSTLNSHLEGLRIV